MKKWCIIGLTVLTLSLNAANVKWERYMQQTLIHHNEIPGWCSQDKARKMMELIYQIHPQVCVEIGVFEGSSIYPTICALRFLKEGMVYAVDPWSNAECMIGYNPDDPLYRWWKKVDMEKVYENFKSMLNYCNFNQYCTILRMSSSQALSQFQHGSIDILHIDGNPTEEATLLDVLMYLPKVKKGGYIWFEELYWDTPSPALELLKAVCTLNTDFSTPTCHLFRKL